MGRKRAYVPLNVFLNGRHVGVLSKAAGGAVEFGYAAAWLEWENAFPVSLSLPLRSDRYSGAPVVAVFENLLPDFEPLRRSVAERMGAAGTDAYSLLGIIGRDCVGALQFLPDGEELPSGDAITGVPLSPDDIAAMLANLGRAPLGLDADLDREFRISIAGAQEKTALLLHEGQWLRPHGSTPTTHILKPQIGRLPNGVDLSNSVENEFYCMTLAGAFGLPVAHCEMQTFGDAKTLVVERFDRRWTRDGRLIRLPQEDCCQALGVPPTQKYQNQGGPGIAAIMDLLKASDDPTADRLTFFKSQVVFWLIGATDGHAKNFSLALGPKGLFRLTPLYDVLTAQPTFDQKHIGHNAFKLSMSVGNSRKYRVLDIHGRHFMETAAECGLGTADARRAIDDVQERCETVFDALDLPRDFPAQIADSVQAAVRERMGRLDSSKAE